MHKLLIVLAIVGTSVSSEAASVYLNGVKINGVRNQEFKNCKVKIDADGNIHINAKGYAIKGGGQKLKSEPTAVTIGAAPTRRYFLVTDRQGGQAPLYEIDVYVGAKWIRKLLNIEPNIYVEITSHLVQGSNKIRLIARKQEGDQGSKSRKDHIRVIIGEGDMNGREVMLTRKLLDFKRTAQDTKDTSDVYDIRVY
jgi:hypothetical protein